MTPNNINIIKRFLIDKISKIIIDIKMENIPYNFEKIYSRIKNIILIINYTPNMLKQAIENNQLNILLIKIYQKISQLKINE